MFNACICYFTGEYGYKGGKNFDDGKPLTLTLYRLVRTMCVSAFKRKPAQGLVLKVTYFGPRLPTLFSDFFYPHCCTTSSLIVP